MIEGRYGGNEITSIVDADGETVYFVHAQGDGYTVPSFRREQLIDFCEIVVKEAYS
jgi:hypothetical protein